MTITLPVENRSLTVDQHAALGNDDVLRNVELQESGLVMSPRPGPLHMLALKRLTGLIDPQVPSGLVLLPEVDLDPELAKSAGPGTVRDPDLVVVTCAEFDHAERARRFLRARHAMLAVEIVSPGSPRIDKVAPYAPGT